MIDGNTIDDFLEFLRWFFQSTDNKEFFHEQMESMIKEWEEEEE